MSTDQKQLQKAESSLPRSAKQDAKRGRSFSGMPYTSSFQQLDQTIWQERLKGNGWRFPGGPQVRRYSRYFLSRACTRFCICDCKSSTGASSKSICDRARRHRLRAPQCQSPCTNFLSLQPVLRCKGGRRVVPADPQRWPPDRASRQSTTDGDDDKPRRHDGESNGDNGHGDDGDHGDNNN